LDIPELVYSQYTHGFPKHAGKKRDGDLSEDVKPVDALHEGYVHVIKS